MRSSKRASKKHKAKRTPSKGTNRTKRPAAKEVLGYLDAAAQLLELPLPPAWRDSVISNLQTTLRLAESFVDFPLPDEAEPAPVFVP